MTSDRLRLQLSTSRPVMDSVLVWLLTLFIPWFRDGSVPEGQQTSQQPGTTLAPLAWSLVRLQVLSSLGSIRPPSTLITNLTLLQSDFLLPGI